MNENVAVLLSVYNGERYIKEQLLSLSKQTYDNFTLYVRDDGCKDKTMYIISNFTGLNIIILQDDFGNVGPAESFLRMLEVVKADIYLFCDQDDYWKNFKIERAVKSTLSFSGFHFTPYLYHSDLELVSADLDLLRVTFHKNDNVDPCDFILSNKILLQNCVVGCTVAFNKKLRDLTIDNLNNNIENIQMHDWWLALHAKYFGAIEYDDVPTVLYRQHSSNVSGSSIKNDNFITRIFRIESYRKIARMIERNDAQAASFFIKVKDNIFEPSASDLKETVRLIGNKSALSYVILYFRGIRYTNKKVAISVIFLLLISGRFL